MHDTSTYTGINCQGFHLAPSVFIVTQISSGLVVVTGAELRLNDDRRVPTPRFTLRASLWEHLPNFPHPLV